MHSRACAQVPTGGSIGTLTGKVSVAVHYFEDGNVQLEDKVVFQCELPAGSGEVGGAFVSKVREYEHGFLAKLAYAGVQVHTHHLLLPPSSSHPPPLRRRAAPRHDHLRA